MLSENGTTRVQQDHEPILAVGPAVRNLAGDSALYREVVGYFFQSAPNLIAAIISGESQDHGCKRRSAHSLKSAARTIGAMRLGTLAEQIEQNIVNKRSIKDLSIQLPAEMRKLTQALSKQGYLEIKHP